MSPGPEWTDGYQSGYAAGRAKGRSDARQEISLLKSRLRKLRAAVDALRERGVSIGGHDE